MYKEVKMKRWRWVEHIVVGKQGQNRKAWAHLTITSKSLQCFHSVENKVWYWWGEKKQKNTVSAISSFTLWARGWGQKLVSVKKKNKKKNQQNLFLRSVWFLKTLWFVPEKLIAIPDCRALLSEWVFHLDTEQCHSYRHSNDCMGCPMQSLTFLLLRDQSLAF